MKFLHLQTDQPLGAIVEEGQTTFRLFAPRARRVTVTFFRSLSHPKPRTLDLVLASKGVWEITQEQSLHGWYYYYQVYRQKEKSAKKDTAKAESGSGEHGHQNSDEAMGHPATGGDATSQDAPQNDSVAPPQKEE